MLGGGPAAMVIYSALSASAIFSQMGPACSVASRCHSHRNAQPHD